MMTKTCTPFLSMQCEIACHVFPCYTITPSTMVIKSSKKSIFQNMFIKAYQSSTKQHLCTNLMSPRFYKRRTEARPRAAAATTELKLMIEAAPVNWIGVVPFVGACTCPSPIWVTTGGLTAAVDGNIVSISPCMSGAKFMTKRHQQRVSNQNHNITYCLLGPELVRHRFEW